MTTGEALTLQWEKNQTPGKRKIKPTPDFFLKYNYDNYYKPLMLNLGKKPKDFQKWINSKI